MKIKNTLIMKPVDALCFCELNYEKIELQGTWKVLDEYLKSGADPNNMRYLLKRGDWFDQRKKDKRGRWLSEFKKDIKEHTVKEQALMEAWVADMRRRGHKVEFKSTGVDNTGEFIETANRDSANIDFSVSIDSSEFELMDMKNAPVCKKATFKLTGDCKRAVNRDAGFILFIGTGFWGTPSWDLKNAGWAVLGPKAVESLTTLAVSTNYPGFGGKPCVMIGPERKIPFDKLFKVYQLGSDEKFKGADNKFLDFKGR